MTDRLDRPSPLDDKADRVDQAAHVTADAAGRALGDEDDEGLYPAVSAEKQAQFEEMRRELMTPREPLPTWKPAPEDTVQSFLRPGVLDALDEYGQPIEEQPLLTDFLRSPAYPFVDGCLPDLVVRRLADLVSVYRAEVHSNHDGTASMSLSVANSDGTGASAGSAEIDLGISDEDSHGTQWRVIGWSTGAGKVTLEFEVAMEPADLDIVVPTLRAARVLQEAERG